VARAAAKTAAGPVALVAMEQWFPSHQRIVSDDLACWMLTPGARAIVRALQPRLIRDWVVRATEGAYPGLWSGMMCRKRFIDETVIASCGAMDAVVNLGAGLDTRAYRLPVLLAGIRVWECDQLANIKLKEDRLRRRFGNLPGHVTLVPVDFDRQALKPTLASHGYTGAGRTLFIWEGVSQYLTEAGIRATLDFLVGAPDGSRLVFSYVRKDFLRGESLQGQQRVYDRFVKPKIWLFGLDPHEAADLLAPYGWRLLADLSGEELCDRYVQPTGRSLSSFPIERVAVAEKRGA
jgi:methyltransferase (TIGR00027 family)